MFEFKKCFKNNYYVTLSYFFQIQISDGIIVVKKYYMQSWLTLTEENTTRKSTDTNPTEERNIIEKHRFTSKCGLSVPAPLARLFRLHVQE